MVFLLPESVSPRVVTLLTGHSFQGDTYRTWRTAGTNDYLLILTLDGQGRFGFAGGDVKTGAGDVVLIAPGTPHDYSTHGSRWELLWAHFHPRLEWMGWLRWPQAAPGLMPLHFTERALQHHAESSLREAHRSATGAGHNREAFAMNALERTLLWCDAACPRGRPIDARVQVAMDFLSREMSRPLSAEEAAQAAGLSASRLAHLFASEVGTSIGRFLEARRMERARLLLERTAMTVGAIAADVGYDNPFYFTLRFQKATGQSPTAFRRAHIAGSALAAVAMAIETDGAK